MVKRLHTILLEIDNVRRSRRRDQRLRRNVADDGLIEHLALGVRLQRADVEPVEVLLVPELGLALHLLVESVVREDGQVQRSSGGEHEAVRLQEAISRRNVAFEHALMNKAESHRF